MSDIKTHQARTLIFTATVSGIDSLSGYTAICAGECFDSNLSGSISGLVITFTETAANMEDITPGRYKYEVIIYSGAVEYTVADGYIIVESTLETAPGG